MKRPRRRVLSELQPVPEGFRHLVDEMETEPVRFYDRSGRPMGWWEHVHGLADLRYSRIASDMVLGWHVSTIWTGYAHGPFETMLFDSRGGRFRPHLYDGIAWTYHTEADAYEGHCVVRKTIRRATQYVNGPPRMGSYGAFWRMLKGPHAEPVALPRSG